MEDSKKKSIMIAVIVVCLASAGIMTYMRSSESSGGIESFRGQMIWVKCKNKACKTEYQMDRKDYIDYVQAHTASLETAPLPCQECGKESVYEAIKCEKCGLVFFENNARQYSDRCPKCKYSKMEDEMKKAIARRRGEQP